MKTRIFRTIIGVSAVLAATAVSAQDVSYSSKPWLYNRAPQGVPNTSSPPSAQMELASTPLWMNGTNSKPWLHPHTEYEIALFREPARVSSLSEPMVRVQDYSSKPWLHGRM